MIAYQFPAVKGVQAKSDYYICMIPLGLLKKLFFNDYQNVPPEYRAQRRLNESRIPEIRNYILNNRDSYVFSALAASVDGIMNFHASEGMNIGILEIDLNATFLINDGQHRKAAIEEAIEEDPSLASESIPVVLFTDKGLSRSQQMFSDLNKHAVISSKSLNTLYESKDEIAIISKNVVDSIPFFHKYTDKEKDNLGKFSSNLFTLNTFYNANKHLLRNHDGNLDDKFQFALEFWKCVAENMVEWNEMDRGELSKRDLRENYIVTQGICLIALGHLGHYLFTHSEIDMKASMKQLSKIDWRRNNTNDWAGRAIKTNGQINRNERGIYMTYLQIKRIMGLPIEKEEEKKDLL